MYKLRGFTLVELIVAVAIVGILAAIAWPSYQTSVMRSNRAEAKTELMDIAQRLQKCYSAYGTYDKPPEPNKCAVLESLDSPGYTTRGGGFYQITIAAGASTKLSSSFVLTAKATKLPQTEDTEGGCNELKLSNTGIKEPISCW